MPARLSSPSLPTAAVRVSSVFCASESVGTAPRPRRSSGTKCMPARRRAPGGASAMSFPKSAMLPAGARVSSPEIAAMSSGCPLPETPAMPTISPPRTSRSMSSRFAPNWWRFARRRRVTSSATSPSFGGARREARRLGADHAPREAGVRLVARVDLPRHSPAAQDGAAVAKRADLVELVADVEDRAPACRERAERLEELLHRLRREHAGRLVEDEELRLRQQRADDLDALPLAHRERVHRPDAGRRRARTRSATARTRSVTTASVGRPVEPEPHVLGRR